MAKCLTYAERLARMTPDQLKAHKDKRKTRNKAYYKAHKPTLQAYYKGRSEALGGAQHVKPTDPDEG